MEENIDYKILHQPNKAIFDLLRNTVYGTKGVKIRHCDTDRKLKELHQPDFHTLWKKDELLAIAVYCKREVSNNNNLVNAYYIRYFSVNKSHQGKGLGTLLTQKAEQHYQSTIKDKTIFYAYIEEKNVQSSGVSKHFEMKTIGKFSTLFFSRFFPKKNKYCTIASDADITKIKSQLTNQYSNHSTFSLNRVNYDNKYYIYKEEGEICAGIQVIKTHWKMEKIPGVIGWLTLNVFPYTPIINRIANGKKFVYLGLEGLLYHPNKINELLTLIEHALAENKTHKAFLYFDSREEIINQLQNSGKLGLLSKIQKSPSVGISNQSINFSNEEQQQLLNSPKYISAYDIT